MKNWVFALSLTLFLSITASLQAQVGWWRLNNDATDASGNALNGTLVNSPVFTTDSKEGSHALTFDGTSQFINLNNPSILPSGTSARTISAWAKTNILSSARVIAAFGTQTAGQAMTIGQQGSTLVGGGFQSNVTVSNFWTTGTWHHICLTYDGTTATLYADGAQVASSAMSWSLVLSRAYIGRNVNNSEYWNGTIDDVRIFNTALSATEVQALATLPPAAPTGLAAVPASSTSINLSWTDASSNEAGFQIERSLSSGSGYSLITTTSANAVSYSDTNLQEGTTYYYRIRATNAGGTSAYTAEVSATTSVTTPVAPSGLAANPVSTTSISLNWTDASSNETGFEIERSLTSGSGYALITTTAANVVTFSDNGLTAGTTYYYRVRAVNAGGNSPYTNEANATTTSPIPAVPTSLIAVATSSTAINLSWTDASNNESGFQIERSLTSGSGFTLVATTTANVVSYSDGGLTASTTYYYRIRATSAAGSSAYTAEVNATTPVTPPAAPSNLIVSAASPTSVSLTWTDNASNEAEFEIERSMSSGSGFTLIATVQTDSVSYSDTGLISGATYYYRVRAANGGGASLYTPEVSVILPLEGANKVCENIFCDLNGGIGIGTSIVPTGYKMSVYGRIMAEGVKVALLADWPDYVFEKDYALRDIPTLQKYIADHGHLPNVPSAQTVEKEGIELGEMNAVLLEKIEELSLYLIQMEERIKMLETENKQLKEKKKK